MRRSDQHLGLVILCAAVVACGDDGATNGDDQVTESSPTQTDGTGTDDSHASNSQAPATTSDEATTSEQSTTEVPLAPFVLEAGTCRPLLQPQPEAVYEGDSVFAHIRSVSGWRDDVYFAEYADFDDIPPRIGRLRPDNSVDTLLDGNAWKLKVVGDTLYFGDDEGIKSLDLTAAGAAPQLLLAVTNVVEYDPASVIFRDETNALHVTPLGAETLDSAVALPEPNPSGVALFGERIYFSDSETVWGVGLDGQSPTALFPADSFNYILALGTDGNTLVYDNKDVLYAVPTAGGSTKALGRAGEDGLFPNSTAAFEQFYFGRGVVYWVDDGSGFGWTALDGQTCGLLGQYQSFNPAAGYLGEDEFVAGGDDGLYRVRRVD